MAEIYVWISAQDSFFHREENCSEIFKPEHKRLVPHRQATMSDKMACECFDQTPEERIMARPVPIRDKFLASHVLLAPVSFSNRSLDYHRKPDCKRLYGDDKSMAFWAKTRRLIDVIEQENKKTPCPECWSEEFFENEKTVHTMEAPPTGSVAAIDWGKPRQEIWVANSANIGNWYTTDIPLEPGWHPHWSDVLHRAKGRTLDLLVLADKDTYKAGWAAGLIATKQAVENAIEELG